MRSSGLVDFNIPQQPGVKKMYDFIFCSIFLQLIQFKALKALHYPITLKTFVLFGSKFRNVHYNNNNNSLIKIKILFHVLHVGIYRYKNVQKHFTQRAEIQENLIK